MNDEHRMPGTGLRALAERMFHRTTLERVILPALADLQYECATDAGNTLRRRWICWRAYWSVWKTLGLCLLTDVLHDSQGVSRTIGRRTLVYLAWLVLFFITPVVTWELSSPMSRLTIAEVFRVAALVLPQAVVPCLPAAFFFALVLFRDDDRPHGAAVVPSLIAGTLGCVLIVFLLAGTVVPKANHAYQSLVFQSLERGAVETGSTAPTRPVKRPSEMTWRELNEQIAHPPDSRAESLARARRWDHFAFLGLVPVLALLGYGLSNRGRSSGAEFFAALALWLVYYVCFSLAASDFAKPYMYLPWVVNGLFLIVALCLLRTPSTPLGERQI
jgi:lipopolysaccharide export LptBFGC system permease protein LptF